MKLVYVKSGEPVILGDRINIGSTVHPEWVTVHYFREPHKPSSEGRVTIQEGGTEREYYASIIGAKWIDRGNK